MSFKKVLNKGAFEIIICKKLSKNVLNISAIMV